MRLYNSFNKGSQLNETRVAFTGTLTKIFDAKANSNGVMFQAFRASIDVPTGVKLVAGHSYVTFQEFIGKLDTTTRYELSILKADLLSTDATKHRNFRIDALATDSLADLGSLLGDL
jgi:hypothetical protein